MLVQVLLKVLRYVPIALNNLGRGLFFAVLVSLKYPAIAVLSVFGSCNTTAVFVKWYLLGWKSSRFVLFR